MSIHMRSLSPDTYRALQDLASAQKDADRYRFLKATVPSVLMREAYFEARGKHGMFAVMEACNIGDVDAAIDAAMSGEGKQ